MHELKSYLGDTWIAGSGDGTPLHDPATGEVIARTSTRDLDIASAHIATFGEKAVDVFYVTDLTGNKIDSENRRKTIRKRLNDVLASPAGPQN